MIDNQVQVLSIQPTCSVAKKVCAMVSLVAVGLVLGILALETVVRVAVPVSDFFYEFDPLVGLKGIPNKRGRAVMRGVFDTPVEINSHGFRDREHAWAKPPGTRRVVLLGDSFIEAMQVPFESSVTPLLEQRLRQTISGIEFVNLGISGLGTAREYLMLRAYGLRYEPDLVLLFFVGNDISDNSRRLQGKPFVPYPVPGPGGGVARDELGQPRFSPFTDQTSRLSAVTTFLRNHSKSYRALREAIDASPTVNGFLYGAGLMSVPPEQVNRPGVGNFGFHEIYRKNPTPAWAEAWALTEAMLIATRELAVSHGARFAVVIVPAAWEVYPEIWEGILNRIPAMREVPMDLTLPSLRLGALLTAQGIPYVSLLPEFKARSRVLPPLYIAGDAHWTPDGHRLAAELIAGPIADFLTSAVGASPHSRAAPLPNGVRP